MATEYTSQNYFLSSKDSLSSSDLLEYMILMPSGCSLYHSDFRGDAESTVKLLSGFHSMPSLIYCKRSPIRFIAVPIRFIAISNGDAPRKIYCCTKTSD